MTDESYFNLRHGTHIVSSPEGSGEVWNPCNRLFHA